MPAGLPDDRPRPNRCRLAAVGLQPLRQGDLDGFCGLYAIVYASRLLFEAERPLTYYEAKRLFVRGISYLSGRSELARTAIAGFDDALWLKLMKVLLAKASKLIGRAIDAARMAGTSAPLDIDGEQIALVAHGADQLLAPAPVVARELPT